MAFYTCIRYSICCYFNLFIPNKNSKLDFATKHIDLFFSVNRKKKLTDFLKMVASVNSFPPKQFGSLFKYILNLDIFKITNS